MSRRALLRATIAAPWSSACSRASVRRPHRPVCSPATSTSAAGYERQIDSRTCTAASTAMMLNFIARRDLNLGQSYILAWEKPRDALDDRVQKGSDPLGWSRAMTYFSTRAGIGSFTYRWESYSTEYVALKHAARVIAETKKPVGLLVASGTHAMVMTGFEATADPRRAISRS